MTTSTRYTLKKVAATIPLFKAAELASGPMGCFLSVPYRLERAALEKAVRGPKVSRSLVSVGYRKDELACYHCASRYVQRCVGVHRMVEGAGNLRSNVPKRSLVQSAHVSMLCHDSPSRTGSHWQTTATLLSARKLMSGEKGKLILYIFCETLYLHLMHHSKNLILFQYAIHREASLSLSCGRFRGDKAGATRWASVTSNGGTFIASGLDISVVLILRKKSRILRAGLCRIASTSRSASSP